MYNTTYMNEISDKDQYDGQVGQPVILASEKTKSQILLGTKDGDFETEQQSK